MGYLLSLNQIIYLDSYLFLHLCGLFISQDSALQASNEQEVKGRDPAVWHVGLKVAWDIETPGLAVPLHQGDIYLMLGNFQGLRSWNFLLKIERIRLMLKKVIISSLQLGLFLFRKT